MGWCLHTGSVSPLLVMNAESESMYFRLKAGEEILNTRTEQLVECLARRQDPSGIVDLKHCVDHWSFDYMVCIRSASRAVYAHYN